MKKMLRLFVHLAVVVSKTVTFFRRTVSYYILFSVIIGFLVFAMAICIGFFVIAFYFIRGLNRKNHIYVKPMMVLLGVVTVLSFLDIFSATISTVTSAIVGTIVYAYEFIVVYSIYSKFADEFFKAPPVYYQPNIEKV